MMHADKHIQQIKEKYNLKLQGNKVILQTKSNLSPQITEIILNNHCMQSKHKNVNQASLEHKEMQSVTAKCFQLYIIHVQ